MARLLAPMTEEPPPAYVAFVACHLDGLRRAADDASDDADDISGEVLTDVAVRWRWFELMRTRLGRADPAAAYLPHALARRCADRREPEPAEPGFEVWADDVRSDPVDGSGFASFRPPPRRVPDSAAVRIARVRPAPLARASALGEAAVAWWHAYEAHLRMKRFAGAALALMLLALLFRLHRQLAVD